MFFVQTYVWLSTIVYFSSDYFLTPVVMLSAVLVLLLLVYTPHTHSHYIGLTHFESNFDHQSD